MDIGAILPYIVLGVAFAIFAVCMGISLHQDSAKDKKMEQRDKERRARKSKAAQKYLFDPDPRYLRFRKKRERRTPDEFLHHRAWTDLDFDVSACVPDVDGGGDHWFHMGVTELIPTADPECRKLIFVPNTQCLDELNLSEPFKGGAAANWKKVVEQKFSPGIYHIDIIMEDEKRAQEQRHKDAEAQREILARMPKCPLCGSTNISPIGAVERGLSVGFLGLASPTIGKSYECRSCHYRW